MNENPQQPAQGRSAGDRLLQVLVTLAESGAPIAARHLAERTGQPLSTVYRHLALLRRYGLAGELGREAGFVPGPVALRMAWALDEDARLASIARPAMQSLVLASGESVGLMVLVHDRVMCIEMIDSPRSLRCSFIRGASFPLARGASAKALLAFLPDLLRQEFVAAHMPDPAARDALHDQLAGIRRLGYAVSDGEVDPGVWGVSVPLRGNGRHPQGSITLMAPSTRAAGQQERLITLTLDAARRVTEELRTVTAPKNQEDTQ